LININYVVKSKCTEMDNTVDARCGYCIEFTRSLALDAYDISMTSMIISIILNSKT